MSSEAVRTFDVTLKSSKVIKNYSTRSTEALIGTSLAPEKSVSRWTPVPTWTESPLGFRYRYSSLDQFQSCEYLLDNDSRIPDSSRTMHCQHVAILAGVAALFIANADAFKHPESLSPRPVNDQDAESIDDEERMPKVPKALTSFTKKILRGSSSQADRQEETDSSPLLAESQAVSEDAAARGYQAVSEEAAAEAHMEKLKALFPDDMDVTTILNNGDLLSAFAGAKLNLNTKITLQQVLLSRYDDADVIKIIQSVQAPHSYQAVSDALRKSLYKEWRKHPHRITAAIKRDYPAFVQAFRNSPPTD
ncbi:hypothetical protein PsorP6_010508 [Peronosclerospora sorghi]|uniref:Uncharacterized protein n=1 Tax=Peronosclerospora sorghi TaxID=230839 RepID=A0ACC0VWV7_9STRA|nr:hypothetical protein PsorP6_010508 [Peronosclerospora sorghi]